MHASRLSLLAGLTALVLPLAAGATNGYFAHGYGTTNKGLAGAGVAFPQDALAPATNPAGIVRLGHRLDAGLALFSPRREYTTGPCVFCAAPPAGFPLEPGTFKSDNELFPIPHLGYSRPLDGGSALGVAVYGNGGMNTEYPASDYTFGPGPFGGGTAGVDLMQLFVAPTYARQVSDRFAVGASAILAYQAFEARGLGAFGALGFSSDPTALTNNGHDSSYGMGFKLGVLANLSPRVDVGFSYQSRIWMSEFDDYAGLFAEQGGFDIPPTATLGMALHLNDDLTLLFDVQRTWYSDIDSVGHPLLPHLMTAQLGDDGGAGFGWEDMTTYKLGVQWQSSADWTWRLGYSHGRQPIRSSEVLFNILAPGVVEDHYTFGFTRRMRNGNELSFAAMYAPEEEVKGMNPLDGQSLTLRMHQFELEMSYSWRMN